MTYDDVLKQLEETKDIYNPIQVGVWKSFIETNRHFSSGEFYKDLFFVEVNPYSVVTAVLGKVDLIPDKALISNIPNLSKYDLVSIFCYDIIGGMGMPLLSLMAPAQLFRVINKEEKHKLYDFMIETYEKNAYDHMFDNIEIIDDSNPNDGKDKK